MKYESETLKALKKACHRSKRDGKWATIPEVRDDSKGIPMSTKIRPILIQLIKESRAEKKKAHELYRPTGGGWGGGSGIFGGKQGDRSQGGRDQGEDIRGGKDEQPNGRQDRSGPRDTLGAAMGAMVLGGMSGGTTGGGQTIIR